MSRIRFELGPYQEPQVLLAQKFLSKPRLDIIRGEVERRGVKILGATTQEEFEEGLKNPETIIVFIDEFFMKGPLTWINIRKHEYPNVFWVLVLSKANRIVSLEAERVGIYKTIEGPLTPIQYDTYVKDILGHFEFIKPTGSTNSSQSYKSRDKGPQILQYSEPSFTPAQTPVVPQEPVKTPQEAPLPDLSMEDLFGEVFGMPPPLNLTPEEIEQRVKGSVRNLKKAELGKIGSIGLRLLATEFLEELRQFTNAQAVEFVSLKTNIPFGSLPQEAFIVLSTRKKIKTREPLREDTIDIVTLIWETHSPLRMDQIIGLPITSSKELVGVVLLIQEGGNFVNSNDLMKLQAMTQDIADSYRVIDFLGRLYKNKGL